ncbi:MAG: NB-ARC domain-containing protein, partial [Thermosynechococcaceae cyanobacterium]
MTASSPEPQTILFLASNPDGLRQVGRELRDVKEGLRRSQYRDQFTLNPCLDVRTRDIQRALLDAPPQIIHFAGNGTGEAGLIFEDESGNPKLVDGAALAGLFALFAEDIRCVVLNGCYSDVQANAIAQHIEYVVGMRQEISAQAAIAFSVGFYDALGAGRDIEFAFGLGRSAIQMEGIPEHLIPILMQKTSHPVELSLFPEGAEARVKLWRVPTLPPNFLERSETLNALKAKVLTDLSQPLVMTGGSPRIGVQGMGGIGKSVLAAALAYDPQVQARFPDGIYWLMVGIEPDLLGLQADLAAALSGDRRIFADLNEGKATLRDLWQGRRSLLILDDVWRLSDAEAFNVLGAECALVMTTRDAELITGLGAKDFSLDLLNDAQAKELLAAWAGVAVSQLPAEAGLVVRECGNLPLALAQCGAMVRDLTPWPDILSDLQDSQLASIERTFSHYPYPSVFKALHVSASVLATTNPIAAERYQELAVFPADELIPETVVVRLWAYTGGLKEKDARKILATLARKGMLRLEGDYPDRRMSLHDLQQDYLNAQHSDLGTVHQQLLEAYETSCPEGWHDGPQDGYFFEHLSYHLIKAQRLNDLLTLLLDFRWIWAKLIATDINAVLADYDVLTNDTRLSLVQGALRLSAYVLSRDKLQLQSQLHGRLLNVSDPELEILVQQIAKFKDAPWLCCQNSCLTPPSRSLIRLFKENPGPIFGVVMTPDGEYLLASSKKQMKKIRGLALSRELRTFHKHNDYITGIARTPDGEYALYTSNDNMEKIWEKATIQKLKGHTDWIRCIAFSPDGKTILSPFRDQTIKLWEMRPSEEFSTLHRHTDWVTSVVVTPNGEYALSASRDQMVKVWELATGQKQRTLKGHSDWVTGVALTDGHIYSNSLQQRDSGRGGDRS